MSAPLIRAIHIVKNAELESTGIFRIVANLAKNSKDHGYELTVLFLSEGPLLAQALAAGISAAVVPWKGTFQDAFGAFRVCNWLRGKQAEIAHLHWGGRTVRTIARLGGAKAVVQHIHGRINEITGEVPSELSVSGVDAVVACSKAVADCVTSHRAEVIYTGIEADPTPQSLAQHWGPLRVGVLSRLTPIKNVDAVLRAVARLRDAGIEIQADIAGSGPSESELRNLAAELQLADGVCFLGWQENIRELLFGWDLLVVPSLDEAFPLSVLEAMAAARPVLATRVGGIPEIVVDGVTGYLIPPKDIDALVDQIAKLATDRTTLAAMGQAGWERVQTEFSVQSMSVQIGAFYDRLCSRRPVRPAPR